MTTGRKPISLEARRAAGEVGPELPVIVGGRPSLEEWREAPRELCTCPAKGAIHHPWCAITYWSEVVPQLVDAKLIDRVDRGALVSYVMHMSRAGAIREEIEWEHHDTCACPRPPAEPVALGRAALPSPEPLRHVRGCQLGKRVRRRTLREQFVSRSVRGFTSNPLLAQEREALREARMIGELLGLNPVGRTRLQGGKNAPKGRGLAGITSGLPRPSLVQPAEAAADG